MDVEIAGRMRVPGLWAAPAVAGTALALTMVLLLGAGPAVATVADAVAPTRSSAGASHHATGREPPVTVPTAVSTPGGTPVVVAVLTGDSDPQGGTLTVTALGEPASGTAVLLADGTVRYSPKPGYVGADLFTYEVTSSASELTSTGTVTVEVTEPTQPQAKLTARPTGKWEVLRASGVTGTAPAAARLTVRVSGPKTDTTLTLTVPATGAWSISFTPAWAGEHRIAVTSATPDDTQSATATVTATATYLSAISGPLTAREVPYSYRPGCPVAPSSLRRLTFTYWDWDYRLREGDLIAHVRAIADLRGVFGVAFTSRFPLRSVRPADHFYQNGTRSPERSDVRAMAADNTSAFNCRPVTGSHGSRRSPHATGLSIDINTRENPYRYSARTFYPRGARTYLNRSKVRKGMLRASSPVVKEFQRRGWRWGTRFHNPDYQHFDFR